VRHCSPREAHALPANVRAVSLSCYIEVASFLGLDAYEMLRGAQLTPQMIADPESRIPARSVCNLLEDSARASSCMTFGLAMAECRTFASLGPLSLLLEHLGSAREIIEALTEYRRHLNDVIILGVDDSDSEEFIRVELLADFATPQAADLAIGVAYVALRGASRFRWQPLEIHFSHVAPDDRAPYERVFGVPVIFGSEFNGFMSSRKSMETRWSWADETMVANARRLLALVELGPEKAPAAESVMRVVSLSLPVGRATLSHVAAQIGKSPRSLQRSLAREGKQFGALLNQVRRALVIQHLSANGTSMTSVAAMLGFFTSSSFSGWFVSEFGVPPRVWRAEAMRAATSNLV